MEPILIITAFGSAIIGAIIGAIISIIGAWQLGVFKNKKNTKSEELKHWRKIYSWLVSLNSTYFFISSYDLTLKQWPKDIINECYKLTWRIHDELSYITIEEHLMGCLYNTLFSRSYLKFPSARDRSNEIEKLVEKVGYLINPKYRKIGKAVDSENQNIFIKEFEFLSNTGLERPWRTVNCFANTFEFFKRENDKDIEFKNRDSKGIWKECKGDCKPQ